MDKIVPRYGQVRGQGDLHGPPTKHGRRHSPAEPHILLTNPTAISARARRRPKKIHAAALAIAWTPVSCVLVSLRRLMELYIAIYIPF